jgi:hypothetical protein
MWGWYSSRNWQCAGRVSCRASSPLAQLYSTSTMEHHHFDQCIMILNSQVSCQCFAWIKCVCGGGGGGCNHSLPLLPLIKVLDIEVHRRWNSSMVRKRKDENLIISRVCQKIWWFLKFKNWLAHSVLLPYWWSSCTVLFGVELTWECIYLC